MAQDITIPDLGDFKDVEVIDVLVKAGDKIDVDTPLITLETEKATMDVPSTAAGVVKSVTIKKGDRVSKGNVIVQVEGGEGAEKKAAPAKPAAPAASPTPPQAETPTEAPKAKAPEASPAPAPAPGARTPPVTINEAGFATAYASPSVRKFARELATLSEKARAGKLSAAEMQGASFTVSSLGGIGVTSFTPIINAPEVAILGVARSSMRPVYQDDKFVPRLILPFTLAYDHRVIDGAAAVRFTTFLAQKLTDAKGLLEAVP
jgi:pyruvate/2-oxoglutarate dehydrogenase complex dihydrolipoamide acyltransferase (E2) component